MQLFATFVENKCNFFNFLVQQKLALIMSIVETILSQDNGSSFLGYFSLI